MILIRIHKSYRNVVAVCDSSLVGKKFEEGKRQLDIRENFYKGEEYKEEEAVKLMQKQLVEDSTFNIAGPDSIKAAQKAGVIQEINVGYIQDIPFALKLF